MSLSPPRESVTGFFHSWQFEVMQGIHGTLILFGFFAAVILGSAIVERIIAPVAAIVLGRSRLARIPITDVGRRGMPIGMGIWFLVQFCEVQLAFYWWVLIFVTLLTTVDLIWLWGPRRRTEGLKPRMEVPAENAYEPGLPQTKRRQ